MHGVYSEHVYTGVTRVFTSTSTLYVTLSKGKDNKVDHTCMSFCEWVCVVAHMSGAPTYVEATLEGLSARLKSQEAKKLKS